MWISLAILFSLVETATVVGLFVWMRRNKEIPYNSKKYMALGIVAGVILFAVWALCYMFG